MELLKRYLEETISTKSSQRRRISKLEKELGQALKREEDAKANELDALDRMNMMKDEFMNEHSKVKELQKEMYEIEQKYEEQIRLIRKEMKNMEKEYNEIKRSSKTKKQIQKK